MESKRAVLYARVSRDDRVQEGRNLAGQLDMCRSYALARGWSIVAELAEDDRGVSGARLDLPQLNTLLDWAKQRRFDVLVVRELDRLARSLPKQLLVESMLAETGVTIEYVLGEYPNTAEGTLLKNVRAAIAELERLKIAERTTRGRILATQAGSIMVASMPPYGYEKDRVNGKTKLRIREDEARIVRLIFEWYGKGDEEGIKRSPSEIARRLTAMGVPTYSDTHPQEVNKKKYVRHGSWSPATIQEMLRKTVYMGQWHYRKRQTIGDRKVPRPVEEQIPVEVPAIVDEATWLAVQVRRERPDRLAMPIRKSKFLLTGHLACGVCGATMFGRLSKGGGGRAKRYIYYGCGDKLYKASRQRRCISPYFRAEPLDKAVWEWVESLLADREMLDRALQALQATWVERTACQRAQLAQVQARRDLWKTRQQSLLQRYLDGKLSRTTWAAQNTALRITLHQLTQEQAILKAALERGNITEPQKAGLHEFASRLLARLQSANDAHEEMRHIFDVINLQVVLGTDAEGRPDAQVSCLFGPIHSPIPPVSLSKNLLLPAGPNERGRAEGR